MIRHSLVFLISFTILVSGSFFEESTCEDDPTIDCASFEEKCADETMEPLLKKLCPVTCKSCPSTVSPTTAAPCEDAPGSNCADFKNLCSNAKYVPMLKQFCPVTCNMCPGATTVSPPTPSPNCHDNESQCAGWASQGFCTNCFYTCEVRIKYCQKTCEYCTGQKTCENC
ncbi:Protein CBG20816, partial [Caenorhabditis briggsae]